MVDGGQGRVAIDSGWRRDARDSGVGSVCLGRRKDSDMAMRGGQFGLRKRRSEVNWFEVRGSISDTQVQVEVRAVCGWWWWTGRIGWRGKKKETKNRNIE